MTLDLFNIVIEKLPHSFTINMASDNETETCKQMESPGVNGNLEDVSEEDARAGSSEFGFGFFPCVRES